MTSHLRLPSRPTADTSTSPTAGWTFTSVVDVSQQQIGQLAFASVQGTSIQTETTQFQVIEQQISEGIREGKTFLLAPGYTGVFSLPATAAAVQPQSWHFPSEIVFGWIPSTDRLVSQSHNPEVYAKRPFGFAMRPDGRRALVPFFQTGNFGVFDLRSPAVTDQPSAPRERAILCQSRCRHSCSGAGPAPHTKAGRHRNGAESRYESALSWADRVPTKRPVCCRRARRSDDSCSLSGRE